MAVIIIICGLNTLIWENELRFISIILIYSEVWMYSSTEYDIDVVIGVVAGVLGTIVLV